MQSETMNVPEFPLLTCLFYLSAFITEVLARTILALFLSNESIRRIKFFFSWFHNPCFLTVRVMRSHWDTPHSVGLLRRRGWSAAETSTWQHTTFSRDALRGIRKRTSSNRAAAHPLLRPHDHWDRLNLDNLEQNNAGPLPTSTAVIEKMADMHVKLFESANSVFGFLRSYMLQQWLPLWAA